MLCITPQPLTLSQTYKIHHTQRAHHRMSSFNGAYAKKPNDRVKRCAIDLVVEDLIIKKQHHVNGKLCRKAVDIAIAALSDQHVM